MTETTTRDTAGRPDRDEAHVRDFIERFADVLVRTGWPRMPARVFVALLANDEGQLTSAELSGTLQVSPAAVSGGIRFLSQLGLASRQRIRGTRRDVYVVHDDVWYQATLQREQVFANFDDSLKRGVQAVGVGSPAGERLVEMRAFFAFVDRELPKLYEQWSASREHIKTEFRPEPPA